MILLQGQNTLYSDSFDSEHSISQKVLTFLKILFYIIIKLYFKTLNTD